MTNPLALITQSPPFRFITGTSMASTVVTGVGMEILWQLSGKPDILLGIIPINTVQRYEVARSHDKMKYRAVAGQFFAHQRGGNVGFKAVLYLIGPETLDYLTYLQVLHTAGNSQFKKMSEFMAGGSGGVLAGLANQAPTSMVTKEVASARDTSWQEEESHFTFTIVTKEEIMHNMYIETLMYERDVSFGDALKVTILCRKYIKPPQILYLKFLDESGATITVGPKTQKSPAGTYDKKVKDIIVVSKKRNVPLRNAIGLAEQAVHRAWSNYYGDPYTDLQSLRTVVGRLSSDVYLQTGKSIYKKIGDTAVVQWGV